MDSDAKGCEPTLEFKPIETTNMHTEVVKQSTNPDISYQNTIHKT